MYYWGGGGCHDNVTLPVWPETRNCLGLRQHGLNPMHLVQCLFLLSPPFLCVEYSCAVVDKKDHTTGAIQQYFFHAQATVIALLDKYFYFLIFVKIVYTFFEESVLYYFYCAFLPCILYTLYQISKLHETKGFKFPSCSVKRSLDVQYFVLSIGKKTKTIEIRGKLIKKHILVQSPHSPIPRWDHLVKKTRAQNSPAWAPSEF